ncbi:site-specific integrase [Helicobacter cetorum]|uniref:Hac prophage II integrase n=1 Tax=Helicobacter cetorum (strain ATCC BAA-540 / CCUG 52418 / MIT 99-5656) TaxID=1163745 RepID=I0ERP4_HELCM|nr:site-specific integrase [Helicobacter cetorum]AFI05613.1 Hac prophage II integrase [Helicobacter cetorum MIT 99-5656]
MKNFTIYSRNNTPYLNYTKDKKRHRISLTNKLKGYSSAEMILIIRELNACQNIESVLKKLSTLKTRLNRNEKKGDATYPQESQEARANKRAKKLKGNETIEHVFSNYLNQKIGLKKTTLLSVKTNFTSILNTMKMKESAKISKITQERVVFFHNKALEKFKKSSLIVLNHLLKSFLDFATEHGYLEKSPYFKVNLNNAKESKEIKPFNLQEIKEILNECPSTILRAFLTTAFFTGLRTGEQLALKWKDIDFINKKINVEYSLNILGELSTPKNKSSKREIDLLEPVERALIELKKSQKGVFIFIDKPQKTREFQKAFTKLLDALNLEKRKIYTTRHTFASLMLSQGEEAMWVSKMLGHKDLNTTYSIYSHYIPQQNRERAAFLRGAML